MVFFLIEEKGFIAMNQIVIHTSRLTLRPFRDDDALAVKELAGNLNVSKYTRNIPYPYEDGMAEYWIASSREMIAVGKELIYAIELTNDNLLIGTVGLIDIENLTGELGFWIGEPYWRNGYCTEAIIALLNYAFESFGLKRIISEHIVSNSASGKIMQKVGMSYIGTKKKEFCEGEIEDLALYEIVRQ